MDLTIYMLYAYVGVICASIIGIILNRTKATAYKQSVDKRLTHVFIFFIIFCLVDAAWGLIGFAVAKHSPVTYEISTYFFHIFAATSSIAISIYSVHYLKLSKGWKTGISIYRLVIFLAQISLILANIIMNAKGEKFWFQIDSDGVYHTIPVIGQNIRYVVFALQFAQYVPLAIYAFIKGLINLTNECIISFAIDSTGKLINRNFVKQSDKIFKVIMFFPNITRPEVFLSSLCTGPGVKLELIGSYSPLFLKYDNTWLDKVLKWVELSSWTNKPTGLLTINIFSSS